MVADRSRLVWAALKIGSIFGTGSVGCTYRLARRKTLGQEKR